MKTWYPKDSLSGRQKISVSLICQGGYPDNSTYGPKRIRRSGSDMMPSESSASTRSIEISRGESLPFCDISASVLVRSTTDSLPSWEEIRCSLR